MAKVLPVALRLCPPPRIDLPDISGFDNGTLDAKLGNIREPRFQPEIQKEADVM